MQADRYQAVTGACSGPWRRHNHLRQLGSAGLTQINAPPPLGHYRRADQSGDTQAMGYVVWGSLALLGGTGGLVATGQAGFEFAELMAGLALIALAGACIWRLNHPGPRGHLRRD